MATARKYLVDPTTPLYYHITSRCVQRAWLLGIDPVNRRNYNHRKDWFLELLESVTPAFAVSVQTYALMSNHFHLVVYYDPLASETWSDVEVAERWYRAHPAQLPDEADEEERQQAIDLLASDPERVKACRRSLGSISEFMKALKQPFAQRANKESETDGHFWSARFYSGAILSEEALLTVMAYVDLNPVRAKIARHIEDSLHTGLRARVKAAEANPKALEAYLEPCFDGLNERKAIVEQPLRVYQRFVEEIIELERRIRISTSRLQRGVPLTREEVWQAGKRALSAKPRAVGKAERLAAWFKARGFKRRDPTLPEQLA